MLKPFILVKFPDNRLNFVSNTLLQQLIREKQIKSLRRSTGWFDVDNDQRKSWDGAYKNSERRIDRIINDDFVSMTIKEKLDKGCPPEMILGFGSRIREIISKLTQVARTDLSVLIQGETGTGKGVTALVMHESSKRKGKPFIAVDCGAIPEKLIESELFGHEKGSFTGAHQKKIGKFQLADKGTIFLDEIGNLPLDMQTRLLRCLEDKIIYRVGGVKPVALNIRIISSSNDNLLDEVKKGNFREDLYYRLNEFEIDMPSLRERSNDIFFFAEKFISQANIELGKSVIGFSKEVRELLLEYPWPGNIREMNNILRRATLLADRIIDMEHLPDTLFKEKQISSLDVFLEKAFLQGCSMHEIIQRIKEEAEKRVINRAYEMSGQKKKTTAKMLKIDYSTLYRKMKVYSIR